ncbi:MAG: DUF817 domain-containing protein [Candidatus Melainabacteria bacterium]|jgi:uncharacterized membrane protein YoaT (DUF817 family)
MLDKYFTQHVQNNSLQFWLREFILFGLKEAKACIFAGLFFFLLYISNHISLFGLARYDFLFIAAVLIQIILYVTGLETKDEVKVICLFHIIGLVLEVYKTNPAIGSWSYPEEGFLKIATVPLYSGFMYAAVGSYISQAWKVFDLNLSDYKHYKLSIILGFLIYLNFFTNHFIYDFRLYLIMGVNILFWKTKVYFTVTHRHSMPLILAFVLIAFFIWLAENLATFWGAWKYGYQLNNWQVVSFHKISSWFLLVIISFIIVADLKYFKKNILLKS